MIDATNPDTTIEAGDRVRSYDWPDLLDDPSREPSFMEGEVERILPAGEEFTGSASDGESRGITFHDCNRYVVRVSRCVLGGDERPVHSETVFPPVNGTPKMTGGVTYGVEKLGDGNPSARSAVFGGDDSAAAFVAGTLAGWAVDVQMTPGEYHETIVTVPVDQDREARVMIETVQREARRRRNSGA